jgi:molecular chaperone GrpE (heat shock protein)
MTEPIEISKDNEFSEELRTLVIEATQISAPASKAAQPSERPLREDEVRAILKPILDGIESRNTVSKSMFEALHGELKTYKDGFILEAVLRPVIRDLISVFDDLGDTHRQLAATISSLQSTELKSGIKLLAESVSNTATNIDHNLHFILEVLERLDVTQMQTQAGKLDKRNQKAVAVESTDNEIEDLDVVRVVRRGFRWRDRVVRPEEVVIKKWKNPPTSSPQPDDAPNSSPAAV